MTWPSGCTRASTCRGEGTVGLITYMRTDSVNDRRTRRSREMRASWSQQQLRAGSTSLAEPRRLQDPSAQRPGGARGDPSDRARSGRRQRVAAVLERDQLRLYTLIWQRTVAAQMADARFDQVVIDIAAVAPAGSGQRARATASARPAQTLKFDGFLTALLRRA